MQYKGTEKLWKPIVRPPRHNYKIKDLGNEIFMVVDTVTKRTDFEILNKRNQTLQCRYLNLLRSLFDPVRCQDKPHPCMIYLHGNSSSRMESFTIIEYLLPYNIAVCGIDLSGSGLSEGEYISLGYYESIDVQCLYEYLRDNRTAITQIGLWGRSMGSVTAILAAQANPQIKIVVCDSPFSNLTLLCQELASNDYKIPVCCFNCFWCFVKSKIRQEVKFNIDDLNVTQIIQTISSDVAIAFLSAKQDDLIKEKHPKLLMDKFRGKKILKQFEGTHNSKRPADVMKETVQFIINNMEKGAWSSIQSARETNYGMTTQQLSTQVPLLKGDRKSVQPYLEKVHD